MLKIFIFDFPIESIIAIYFHRYGIALDGQRGNRLHIFTQEELLTQAVSILYLFSIICIMNRYLNYFTIFLIPDDLKKKIKDSNV